MLIIQIKLENIYKKKKAYHVCNCYIVSTVDHWTNGGWGDPLHRGEKSMCNFAVNPECPVLHPQIQPTTTKYAY